MPSRLPGQQRAHMSRHICLVMLFAVIAFPLLIHQSIAAQASPVASTATPQSTHTPATPKDLSLVPGKYIRKGVPTDVLELRPDGKCTLQQSGHKLEGTYKVAGEVLTLRSPTMLVPALATFTSTDSILDADGIVWEREPILTNQEIIKLVKVDLGDEIVIAKIKNAPQVRLDVSTDALLALKQEKVSSPIIAAMIERAARPAAAAPPSVTTSKPDTAESRPPALPISNNPCTGVELMGLYKNEIFDRAMGGGVVEWLAQVRNNTGVTKIAVIGWRDMYGEQKKAQYQIRGGQITSARLDMTQARAIPPVTDLRLLSCE